MSALVKAIKFLLDNPKLRIKIGRRNKLEAERYLADKLAVDKYEYLVNVKQKCS